jgi:hypothetical protein
VYINLIENDVEKYLIRQVKAIDGLCWKWVSPGRRGVPDRIVVLPGGGIYFVELKAPGKTERPDQVLVQKKLRGMSCVVYSSVDSKDAVNAIVGDMQRRSGLI